MSLFTHFFAWGHDRMTLRKMERMFQTRPDPYDYATSSYEQARLKSMADAVSDRRYGSALEIGCGEGFFTETLAAVADDVIALDIAATPLGRARARLAALSDRIAFVEANIREWLPPVGRTFDLIVASDILYYLGERNDGVRLFHETEFRSLLARVTGWLAPATAGRPGGRMLLSHGYVGDTERGVRQAYRTRFETLGLSLEREWDVGGGTDRGGTACLMSLLRKGPA